MAKSSGATLVSNQEEKIYKLGRVSFKVLKTPGKTNDSIMVVLIDRNGIEHCIFSGNTLYIDDIGFPDVFDQNENLNHELASFLY